MKMLLLSTCLLLLAACSKAPMPVPAGSAVSADAGRQLWNDSLVRIPHDPNTPPPPPPPPVPPVSTAWR